MAWNPEMASLPLEQEMERKELPEEDRDELRRFAEVLRRRKATPKGEAVPLTGEMKEWLQGKE